MLFPRTACMADSAAIREAAVWLVLLSRVDSRANQVRSTRLEHRVRLQRVWPAHISPTAAGALSIRQSLSRRTAAQKYKLAKTIKLHRITLCITCMILYKTFHLGVGGLNLNCCLVIIQLLSFFMLVVGRFIRSLCFVFYVHVFSLLFVSVTLSVHSTVLCGE